jgi:hypothetical protein
MIPRLCVAHKPPQVSAHLYDAVLDTPRRDNYEVLVSVVAHPLMARLAPVTPVGICSYRKLVVRGEKSHGQMTLAECARLPREQTEPVPGHEYLLCWHDFFKIAGIHKSVKEQWAAAHHEADLHDCLNLAVEMGIFTRGEIRALESEPALIEGGFSMGVYPGELLRRAIETIMPLYYEFVERHGSRFRVYNPVQRRCVAFMAERIETHFILKDLRRRYPRGFPKEIFGTLTIVNDGPWVAGTMPA